MKKKFKCKTLGCFKTITVMDERIKEIQSLKARFGLLASVIAGEARVTGLDNWAIKGEYWPKTPNTRVLSLQTLGRVRNYNIPCKMLFRSSSTLPTFISSHST